MKCPECNAASSVLSTRNSRERRRKCFNGHTFRTTEVLSRQLYLSSFEQQAIRNTLARHILKQKGYLQ